MTKQDIIDRLRTGDKIRYYPLGGALMFAPEFNKQPEWVPIAEFLELREEGIISCDPEMKYDALLMRDKYELYSIVNINGGS